MGDNATRWFIRGAMWAIVAAFPIAGFFALFYRFPIPLGGYYSGVRAVVPSLFAVALYGVVTGGFLILAVLGGAGGWLTSVLANTRHEGVKKRLCMMISCGVACLWAGTLAILDKIIGPW